MPPFLFLCNDYKKGAGLKPAPTGNYQINRGINRATLSSFRLFQVSFRLFPFRRVFLRPSFRK
jgi:hypothetical protein